MIVEIDAGNTRIKWRIVDAAGEGLAPVQTAANEDELLAMFTALQGQASPAAASAGSVLGVARIRVASVRNSEQTQQLLLRLEQLFDVVPEQAKTAPQTGLIRNSYADPERMGVDRWSAIVAASHVLAAESASESTLQRQYCIVSAGTALTIDFVGRDGSHCGGYILPGYRLQIQALLGHTDRVVVDEALAPANLAPANNTSMAVHAGVLKSLVSLINDSVADFASSGPIELFLCGGDASLLAPHIACPVQLEQELVLDGLQWLLP